MKLGERLRDRRKEMKLSQVALAKRSGVSQATISDLESGAVQRSTSLPEIATALGISTVWLATGRMSAPDMPTPSPQPKAGPETVLLWVYDQLSKESRAALSEFAMDLLYRQQTADKASSANPFPTAPAPQKEIA